MQSKRHTYLFRQLGPVLLGLVLLFAQLGLITHEIKHWGHAPDAPCEVCLTAHHLDKVPPAMPLRLPVNPQQHSITPAATTPASRHGETVFQARAPPVLLYV